MKIFVLEDDENRLKFFRQSSIGCELHIAENVVAARTVLAAHNDFDQIFLDHDLSDEHYLAYFAGTPVDDATTGYAIAEFLSTNPSHSPNATVVVHSLNPAGSERMMKKLQETRKAIRQPFPHLVKANGVS